MRLGVVILPDAPWAVARERWRKAESLGFDHAWTYDHLTWRSLRDGPWFGAVPTLAAAASVTARIRLGTLVASPNFRHPVPFAKELMSLDVLSAGRIIAGLGAGGGGFDVLLIRDSYKNWGFPKGHVEPGEEAAAAAVRETREETGLTQIVMRGPIREIDWFFRFKGRLIHKTCHFFLLESPHGDAAPQQAEGISAVRWLSLDEALRTVSYANARDVLREAGEMVERLSAV